MRAVRVLLLPVLAAVAALLALPSTPVQGASTMTVDSTFDSNNNDTQLTLREAILLANGGIGAGGLNRALNAGEADNVSGVPGAASADTIIFASTVFPTGSPVSVTLGNFLPALTGGNDTVTGAGAGVIVRGIETRTIPCFTLNSNNNSIFNLAITDCQSGISVNGSSNIIGNPNLGNTIYDSDFGVTLNAAATSNQVRGNKIGTDSAGAAVHADGPNVVGVFCAGRWQLDRK
jgi:hypothetical protein